MASSRAHTPSLSRGSLCRQSFAIRTGCANERPSGSGRGAISNDRPYRDWEEFGKLTKSSKLRNSWIDAITSVVTASLQGQLDVDNSQVIVSNDERHAFRVILTTGTRYFNGIREFNLCFVEY